MASHLWDNNIEIRSQIVWNKNMAQFGALSAQYKQKHEPCFYCFKKGNAPFWYGPTNEVTVWDVSRESKNEFHPTQKPIELPSRALNNSSKKGDCILDLFLGSGSTMVASHQLKRKCYGMELDPKYCQVIIDRMKKLDDSLVIKRNGQII
jgi:DNA modification methylase